MSTESPAEDSSLSAHKRLDIISKVTSGVYGLTPRGTGRSQLWTLFSEIRKEDGTILEGVVFCNKCSRLMTYNGKTSSNLNRHRCYLRGVPRALRKKNQSVKVTVTRRPAPAPAAGPFNQRQPTNQQKKSPYDGDPFDRDLRQLTNYITKSERKYEWLGEQVVVTLNDLTDNDIIDETIFAVQKLLHDAKLRHRNSSADIQDKETLTTRTLVEMAESVVVKDESEPLSSPTTTEDSEFVSLRPSSNTKFLAEFM